MKNSLFIRDIKFSIRIHIKFSSSMAIYTNISEDHLDRHHSMKEYKNEKKIIKNFTEKILSYLIMMMIS